jgi:PAS domain S-box-containing protein
MKSKNQENDHYYLSIDMLEDGFIEADNNGRIVRANHMIVSMCGYDDAKEMIGMKMSDLYASHIEREKMLNELEKNGKLINYELKLKRQNGDFLWTLSNIKIIYDDNGNRIGTQGVIRDITEHKIMQEELAKLNYDMGERLKELHCLYNVTKAITTYKDIDLIINVILESIPPAWQYPEITCAEITIGNKNYKSKRFKKSQWKQSADIVIDQQVIGQINIYYLKKTKILDEGPFMKEERDLINSLASYLSKAIKENELQKDLIKTNQRLLSHENQLKALNQQLRASNQQLQANEQQLQAANQQLKSSFQQLAANEQQLRAANEELKNINKQLVQNEMLLLINQKRYKRAQQIGHVGNWEYNIQTKEFWGSDEAKRIYGFDSSSMNFTTEEVESCIPERRRIHQALIDLIEDNKPYDLEFEIRSKDKGEFKYIHSVAELELDNKGNPVKVSGLIHDITESRKTQEKLEELAKFPSENPFPVIRISKDGDVLYHNKSSNLLLEHWDYNNKTLPDDIWDYAKKTLNENSIKYMEVTIGSKSLSLAFVPIMDKGFINVYGMDISDRKKVENILREALNKAEEADKLKSAFLANMSHEIRTPMNGILGFSSLLQRPNLTGETRDKYLKIIQKSGERMLNTVNDLISISKIETGQENIRNELANPCELISNLYDFFKPSAEEKGLELVLKKECSHKDQMINTDVTKFNSIISNLIKNALKYTDSGVIEITCFKDNEEIIVKVKDTGKGIHASRLDAIFDRFVQADINDRNVYEGSGLGLSIVKAYVEMLNGTINVESTPGIGSCFTVTLPLNTTEKAVNGEKTEREYHPGIKLNKILIAEDDDFSYQHLSISLDPIADLILHAVDGEQAIKIAKENSDIDLILMDIKMPKINGYDAISGIRSFNAEVPIIVQTAYAMSEDKEMAMQSGCNGFISKPIDIDELITMINGLMT